MFIYFIIEPAGLSSDHIPPTSKSMRDDMGAHPQQKKCARRFTRQQEQVHLAKDTDTPGRRRGSAPGEELNEPLHVCGAGVDYGVGQFVGRHEAAVEVLVDLERRLYIGMKEFRRYVDLRDTAFDRAAHVRKGRTAAAVQNQRRVGERVSNRRAARYIEFGFGLVVAVGRADRDGERVNARGPGERDRLADIGERRLVALRDMTYLALARRAERVGVVGDMLRPLHVLVVRRARAVVHHRGVAPRKRVRRLLHSRAVVEVERHRHLRAERQPLKGSCEVEGLPCVEKTHVELDHHRLVLGLGRLEDRRRRLVVGDIERADGLSGPAGGVQHLFHVYKHDAASSSIVAALSFPYFTSARFV